MLIHAKELNGRHSKCLMSRLVLKKIAHEVSLFVYTIHNMPSWSGRCSTSGYGCCMIWINTTISFMKPEYSQLSFKNILIWGVKAHTRRRNPLRKIFLGVSFVWFWTDTLTSNPRGKSGRSFIGSHFCCHLCSQVWLVFTVHEEHEEDIFLSLIQALGLSPSFKCHVLTRVPNAWMGRDDIHAHLHSGTLSTNDVTLVPNRHACIYFTLKRKSPLAIVQVQAIYSKTQNNVWHYYL